MDAIAWDYRLDRDTGSPCIDAGDNSVIGHGAVDLLGNPRIVDCLVDMGAYETPEDIGAWQDPAEPGLVVVVGEAPQPLEFEVEVNSWYQLSFNDTRIRLWDSPAMETEIGVGSPVFAGEPAPGCELDLLSYLALQRCFTADGGGPVGQGCDGFDSESDDDVDLTDYATFYPTGSGPVCNTVTVYVQGVDESDQVGADAVKMYVRPPGETSYFYQATRLVTSLEINITSHNGVLGTPLTVTLDPAGPPLAFNAATTAVWDGRYTVGEDETDPFQMFYNAQQFREGTSLSEATLIVGDGTFTDAPSMLGLDGQGRFNGEFTFDLGTLTLRCSHFFDLNPASAGNWEAVDYPYNGVAPPSIAGEPATLPVMPLSHSPDPLNPLETLLYGADSFHIAAVVRIEGSEEPGDACDDPPQIIEVDLVSFDRFDDVLDRIEGLALYRAADDGDPTHFVYHNNLESPIVLVDVKLDPGQYPGIIPFQVVDGGSAVIVANPQ